MGRLDGGGWSAELAVSVVIQWPETSTSERLHFLFYYTAAVFLLYSGFPVLFPQDHNLVPFLKNVGHLHGPATTYFTRCSILWHMHWTYCTFNFCFKKTFAFERYPDVTHCCNCCVSVCQADIADHLKLLASWVCICSDMVGVIGLMQAHVEISL